MGNWKLNITFIIFGFICFFAGYLLVFYNQSKLDWDDNHIETYVNIKKVEYWPEDKEIHIFKEEGKEVIIKNE